MNKNIIIFKKIKAAMLALLLCLGARDAANAQSYVLPTASPTGWYLPGSTVIGLNTAMIVTSCSELYAFAEWDGTNGGFMVTDPSLGSSSFTALSTLNGIPDIVLGNHGTFPDKTFTLAVAYVTSSGVSGGPGVEVDVYKVADCGISLGLTYVCSYTYPGTPTAVGIDVIADYSNTSTTGYPYCEYAAITWDDNTGGNYVYAATVDLFSTSGGTLTRQPISNNGMSPDVAAIKRTVSGYVHPHQFALITYTDPSGLTLCEQEWDITLNTVGMPDTLQSFSSPSNVITPRIDAYDDYNINSNTGQSNYKVVAQVYNNSTGYNEVWTFDDYQQTLTPDYWPSSTVISSLPSPCASSSEYNSYYPSVALGGPAISGYPNDGSQYLIAHFIDDGGTYPADKDVVFMEPVDYQNPQQLYTGPNDYYWASENGAATTTTSYNFASSVSSPCNNPTGQSMIAWAYPQPPLGNSLIEYKITPYPYSFRPSAPTAAGTVNTGSEWSLYPNPAEGQLMIGNAGSNSRYEVTDMAGRAALDGSLQNGQINIHTLPPGTYILKLYAGDMDDGKKLFVKE